MCIAHKFSFYSIYRMMVVTAVQRWPSGVTFTPYVPRLIPRDLSLSH